MCLTVKPLASGQTRKLTSLWLGSEHKALAKPSPRASPWSAIWRRLNAERGALLSQLEKGSIAPRPMLDSWRESLADGHARSWYAGRALAGDSRPFSVADELVGRGAMDNDQYFLTRFLSAVEDGAYGGFDGEPWDTAAIGRRMMLYANKTRGTSNEAFVMASPEDLEFFWTLGAAEHCPDCLDFSGLNPWVSDEVYASPGDGSTACVTNCKCRWVRSDGVAGFAPI